MGIELPRIGEALAGVRSAFGRVETIAVAGVPVSILLIKNPAGTNEVLRTLRLESAGGGDLDLWIALNDNTADGHDVSWVWDADFELLDGSVRRVVCAGTRAPEIAVRLKYAGVDPARIEVEPRIAASLDRAVAGSDGRLFALPTYTALLELRRLLSERGLAREFWDERRSRTPGVPPAQTSGSSGTTSSAAPTPPTCALWERLARPPPASGVLDLGCGTGRVALHLARRGHRVTGIDSDPALVGGAQPARRARPLCARRRRTADVREFDLGRRFGLVLAPMQLLQLLADGSERRRCLACVARHLAPGGRLAAAILAPEGGVEGGEEGPPIPDVREEGGWVYSSLPVAVTTDGERILIRRLRQRVSPEGALSEQENEVSLADLPAASLEAEAAAAGLAPAGREAIAPTEDHVGSTVVLMEAR